MSQLSRSLIAMWRRKWLNKSLLQVKKSLAIPTLHKSTTSAPIPSQPAAISCLESRGLIRLHGSDTIGFLQGLVTNDVDDLSQHPHSLQYSLMLNVQGRVLYDLFLFNMTEKEGGVPTLLVDVHKDCVEELISLLKKYKLRRKVDIAPVHDEFQVWTQFSPNASAADLSPVTSELQNTIISCPDPRVPKFGRRLIRTNSTHDDIDSSDERVYTESRYRWGIPEGVDDLPPGDCFPLESNVIFMNGVDFQKGCYIGQELTARTHHTGVTRKRLMPLLFEKSPIAIEKGASIKTDKGRNAGKFRGSEGNHGMGLIRLRHVKDKLSIAGVEGNQIELTASIPDWWPELTLES